MKNKIFVVNLKKVIVGIIMICLVMALSIIGDDLALEIIETNASGKLLPIYSVETVDKVVALTFDCAWSQSQ